MESTHGALVRRSTRAQSPGGTGALVLWILASGCSDFGDDGRDPVVIAKTFAPVDPLTPAQVDAVVRTDCYNTAPLTLTDVQKAADELHGPLKPLIGKR